MNATGWLRLASLLCAVSLLTACGGSSVDQGLKRVRIVNALIDAQTVEVVVGDHRVTLAPREATPQLPIDTATNRFQVILAGGVVVDMVAQFPVDPVTLWVLTDDVPGQLQVLTVRISSFESATQTPVHFVPTYQNFSIFILPPGAPLSNVSPRIAQLRFPLSVLLEPGTYQLVITPLNEPAIWFQSHDLRVALGEPFAVILVPRSRNEARFEPLLVSATEARTLVDSRPN